MHVGGTKKQLNLLKQCLQFGILANAKAGSDSLNYNELVKQVNVSERINTRCNSIRTLNFFSSVDFVPCYTNIVERKCRTSDCSGSG